MAPRTAGHDVRKVSERAVFYVNVTERHRRIMSLAKYRKVVMCKIRNMSDMSKIFISFVLKNIFRLSCFSACSIRQRMSEKLSFTGKTKWNKKIFWSVTVKSSFPTCTRINNVRYSSAKLIMSCRNIYSIKHYSTKIYLKTLKVKPLKPKILNR